MAKLVAPGIQVQRQTTAAPEARINQYVQLLWVVAAGGLGIALLCVAASIGLADTNLSASAALQSRSIVDLAIANVNTAQALTVEAFSGFLPAFTAFPSASDTATLNPTFTITSIASLTPPVIASRTSIPLTRTRRPGEAFFFPTSTRTFLPTYTKTSQPPPTHTLTFVPTETSSPAPSPTVITKTPRPTRTRTRTPTPLPTNTLVPAPTNTAVPPPTATDTSIPPPTYTSAPPPPATDTSIPPPPPTDTSAPPPAPTDTSGPPASTNTP